MIPGKLSFLGRFDNFYQVIINSVKENKINEQDFYMILGAKCKQMNRERIPRRIIKVIGAKKGDLKV